MKPEIKAIIFDLGNVLVNFDGKQSAKRFAKDCKVPLLKVFHYFFFSPDGNAYICGKITSTEFYRRSKKALRVTVDYQTFKRYWCEIFWENKGMEDLVIRLKKKYRVYLISNTNQLHFDYIKKKYSILKHFDGMFPSHVVGACKPEAAIYRKALASIKFKPAQLIFIDDIPAFVRAAKKQGMHGIRFKTRQKLVSDLKKYGVVA